MSPESWVHETAQRWKRSAYHLRISQNWHRHQAELVPALDCPGGACDDRACLYPPLCEIPCAVADPIFAGMLMQAATLGVHFFVLLDTKCPLLVLDYWNQGS